MFNYRTKRLHTLFVLILWLSLSVSKSDARMIHNLYSDAKNHLDSARQTAKNAALTKSEPSHSEESNNQKSSDSGLAAELSKFLPDSPSKMGDSDVTTLLLLNDLEGAAKKQDSTGKPAFTNLIESREGKGDSSGETLIQKLFSIVDEEAKNQDVDVEQDKNVDLKLRKYDSKNRFDLEPRVVQSRIIGMFDRDDSVADSSNAKSIHEWIDELNEFEKKETADFTKRLTKKARLLHLGLKYKKAGENTAQHISGASEGTISLDEDNTVDEKKRERVRTFLRQRAEDKEKSMERAEVSRVDEGVSQLEKNDAVEDLRTESSEGLGVSNVELGNEENKREENVDGELVEERKSIGGKDRNGVDEESETYAKKIEESGLNMLQLTMATEKMEREEELGKTTKPRGVANENDDDLTKPPIPSYKEIHTQNHEHPKRKIVGTERCIMEHAQCPLLIILGRRGRSCGCEEVFRQCLRHQNNTVSHLVGVHYFDHLAVECFTFRETEECGGLDCRVVHVTGKRLPQF